MQNDVSTGGRMRRGRIALTVVAGIAALLLAGAPCAQAADN
jgi:hypothetical protein